MFGMALGVASLIVVLSVMNGFAAELRDRILSLIPHGYVNFLDDDAGRHWSEPMQRVADMPGVVAVAPFLREQVLLGTGRSLQGARLFGVSPADEAGVSRGAKNSVAGQLAGMGQEPFGVVLGTSLAHTQHAGKRCAQ